MPANLASKGIIMAMSLQQLSEKMKDIDFAMLATHTMGGAIGARAMSKVLSKQ